jgi:hypothetical protein|tara:strand:+ start:122 stop:478 length:357 start_codon:yes stop_codon:yes gene_type:complete
MRASLFDQLYHNIDISAGAKAEAPEDPVSTPAQKTPEVQDVAQQQGSKGVTGMKFTHSLIKHLDMLYSKMLAGEVADIASEPSNNPKQKVIVGQTDALVLEEKEAFFNPGNSAVTESM